MMNENAETNYSMYSLYRDSFKTFVFEVIHSIQTLQHKPEIISEPPYLDEDKFLIITPKTKPKTILEMFQKI